MIEIQSISKGIRVDNEMILLIQCVKNSNIIDIIVINTTYLYNKIIHIYIF